MNHHAYIIAELNAGKTVITPNNRLSHQLLRDFMRAGDGVVYDKPHCLPYPEFLRQQLNNLLHLLPDIPHPVLLNMHQTRYLWQQIIEVDVPCTEALLNQVDEAWTRCQLWLLDTHDAAFSYTTQTEQFARWADAFQAQLTAMNALTEAQLAPYLSQFSEHLMMDGTRDLVWVSFDDFTPQQRLLQETLRAKGITQTVFDIIPREQITQLYAARDTRDEITQMIAWLKAQRADGNERIALIVPDLQQRAMGLKRRLLRHFTPDDFELSLGQSLGDYPLVSHAMHWLALNQQLLTNHEARLLLNSPYLSGGLSELSDRANLLEENRLLQEDAIPYDQFLTSVRASAPKLAALLEQLTDYPKDATLNEWAVFFKHRLIQLGFPGEIKLDTVAFQIQQRFLSLFDDLESINLVKQRMRKVEALALFKAIAEATVFQIKKTPAPIQISGLLEASGCEYDAIWVMGLTDQCLPQRVKLSPFIPMHLQRDQRMPHALPEREYQLAQQLLTRLRHGSLLSIFSYPELVEDTPNLPSPLIVDYPAYKPRVIDAPILPIPLETYTESYVLPLLSDEQISGGTSLLAYQAQCPFRAFAAHRLRAKRSIESSTGLNDAERGQLIHKVLEDVWKKLGDQEVLTCQSSESLQQIMHHAIDAALQSATKRRSCSFPPLVQSIERERLISLLQASFNWERERPAFRVKAIEQIYTIRLADIDFSVRVDRLDETEEGELWVIDYKSTIPTTKPWHDERPENPQLLLYALLDDDINALLFLQLKTGDVRCNGISQHQQRVAGLTCLKKDESWTEKREEWRQRLTQLATEIRDGHCPPLPQKQTTCTTCEYRDLCRIER